MNQTLVVNMKQLPNYDVYIGRQAFGMHYGNPFTHSVGESYAKFRVNTRKEAVQAYEDWLNGTDYTDLEPERRQWILNHLEQLRGKKLGCFCKPKACHGDVLVKLLNAKQVEDKIIT